MTEMKPQEGKIIAGPSLRGSMGRSAAGHNGRVAKEKTSAVWQGGLDAGKYFWRSGREKCFSLDIPFNRTSGPRLVSGTASQCDSTQQGRLQFCGQVLLT